MPAEVAVQPVQWEGGFLAPMRDADPRPPLTSFHLQYLGRLTGSNKPDLEKKLKGATSSPAWGSEAGGLEDRKSDLQTSKLNIRSPSSQSLT